MDRKPRSAFNPLRVARRLWPPLLFLVILIALWELALAVEYVSETILPHPKDIAVSFYELIQSSFVWDDIGATLWESVAGFLLGAALGLALAIPSGLSPIMRQMLTHLMVPGSLPVMFAGLKTAAGLSLVGAVVGEFISAERGLGVLVQQFSSQLAIADAFAVILMLMILGLLLYGAMEWLERTAVFLLHEGRLGARSKRRAAKAQKKLARGGGVPSGPAPTLAGRR